MSERTQRIEDTFGELQIAQDGLTQAVLDSGDEDAAREAVILAARAHRAAVAVPHEPTCVFCGHSQPWEGGEMVKLIVTNLTVMHTDMDTESGVLVESRQLKAGEHIEFYATRKAIEDKFGFKV